MTTPTPKTPLRIGTRGSPLALAQAYEPRTRLMDAWDLPEDAFEIAIITTAGDRIQDRALREVGGKGLFTREIEEQLTDGRIDIAVHSMKDMPTLQPDGLVIDCLLEREDPRDAFVSHLHDGIAALPRGAVVGTSSLRRRAQLLHRRDDLTVVEFRGNVQTRLRKLSDGVAEATFLAMAGLRRLGLSDVARGPVAVEDMLPAMAQGCIGIERRVSDTDTASMLAPLNHAPSAIRLAAERACLARLDGSCETPIAGLAELSGNTIRLRVEVLRPDGSDVIAEDVTADASDAEALGEEVGQTLLGRAPVGFFEWRENAPA